MTNDLARKKGKNGLRGLRDQVGQRIQAAPEVQAAAGHLIKGVLVLADSATEIVEHVKEEEIQHLREFV